MAVVDRLKKLPGMEGVVFTVATRDLIVLSLSSQHVPMQVCRWAWRTGRRKGAGGYWGQEGGVRVCVRVCACVRAGGHTDVGGQRKPHQHAMAGGLQ